MRAGARPPTSSCCSTRTTSAASSRSSAARQQLLQRTYRQTVAALAGALETKDIGTASHSQRVQRYAVELARRARTRAPRRHERGVRLPPARRRQDRHPRPHPAEAGAAERRGAEPDARAHRSRRAAARARSTCCTATASGSYGVTTSAGTAPGYPDRMAGEEIPLAARDLLGRRCPRRDHERPALSRRAQLGHRRRRDPRRARPTVRPRRRRRVSRAGTPLARDPPLARRRLP